MHGYARAEHVVDGAMLLGKSAPLLRMQAFSAAHFGVLSSIANAVYRELLDKPFESDSNRCFRWLGELLQEPKGQCDPYASGYLEKTAIHFSDVVDGSSGGKCNVGPALPTGESKRDYRAIVQSNGVEELLVAIAL